MGKRVQDDASTGLQIPPITHVVAANPSLEILNPLAQDHEQTEPNVELELHVRLPDVDADGKIRGQ